MVPSNTQKLITRLRESVIIRILYCPIYYVKQAVLAYTYPKSENSKRIKKFKGKYQGQRCFIIGNGPSLIPEDLDRLKSESCFASNRIYCMFDRTEWRPTFFMSFDMNVLARESQNIANADLERRFINLDAKKRFQNLSAPICYIFFKGRFKLNKHAVIQAGVSDDVSRCFSLTNTITCTCIEFALYMGFTSIYLLGVDHAYSLTRDLKGKIHQDTSVKTYFSGMKGGEDVAIQSTDHVAESYKVCRHYAEEHGVKIYNATRGGKLEVFERVNFDTLWEEK
jgi:Uncharacterized protein conserved in bacteria